MPTFFTWEKTAMINHKIKAPLFSTVASIRRIILSLLVLPACAFAQSPDGIIIFGDSLSDPGNFFHQRGETVKAPFEPIPDAPYSIGGNHFSNGATWVEQLAEKLNLDPGANPAVINPGRFTNMTHPISLL